VTYKEARVYLDDASKYGSVLGLDTIRGLLDELGNPQDALKFIHIAGTNGKGSVLAYTSTILSEAGYRTGRYVSPTVISYLERIQINGEWITPNEFAELVEEVQKAIVRMKAQGEGNPTVFEIETAIAFLYFKKSKCDLVVLETGLGGQMDATNIVKNTLIAVFTSISKDHMGILGDTLKEIAKNKAGIIKPGCLVVTILQKKEVMEELFCKADKMLCGMKIAAPEQVNNLSENWTGQKFSYGKWDIEISLAGKYQILNAITALETIQALTENGFSVPDDAIITGFRKTKWLGRFTCIGTNPLFIVDGAHNEDAALRLRDTLEQYFPNKRLIFIMGVFRDKEYHKIARILAPLAQVIYTVGLPDANRSLEPEVLSSVLKLYCKQTEPRYSIAAAVKSAYQAAGEQDIILAFGSLSYLGQVMEQVKEIGEIENGLRKN
jgi:folylpolyglutamate synthase/dihydrofolate synthase